MRAVCLFVCSFVHDTRIRTSRIFRWASFFFFMPMNIWVVHKILTPSPWSTLMDYTKMDNAAEV